MCADDLGLMIERSSNHKGHERITKKKVPRFGSTLFQIRVHQR
jgi:hypothetical protein